MGWKMSLWKFVGELAVYYNKLVREEPYKILKYITWHPETWKGYAVKLGHLGLRQAGLPVLPHMLIPGNPESTQMEIGSSIDIPPVDSLYPVQQNLTELYEQIQHNSSWFDPILPFNGSAGDRTFWYQHFDTSLNQMQLMFWNGTYWPSTIQWTSAFINTLLAASSVTYADYLVLKNETAYNTAYRAGITAQELVDLDKVLRVRMDTCGEGVRGVYVDEDVDQILHSAYDDVQWVVLEWLEALEWKYDETWSDRTHDFYKVVQDKWDTSLCGGGLTWNPAKPTYKNTITNQLFISSSVGMYLWWTGSTDKELWLRGAPAELKGVELEKIHVNRTEIYLGNAVKAFNWFYDGNFMNDQGLFIDGYHVSPNQTTCDQRNDNVYTYNQGVILSGLRGLFDATGDVKYLNFAYANVYMVLNATGWNMTAGKVMDDGGLWRGLGKNGIMEDRCDETQTCDQDAQLFKGIYFHHFSKFCRPIYVSNGTANINTTKAEFIAIKHGLNCENFRPWVEHNALAALATRDAFGIFGGWWGAKGNQSCEDDTRLFKVGKKICAKKLPGKDMQDVNSLGRGRTIETAASGVSVVKAALDLNLWYGPKE